MACHVPDEYNEDWYMAERERFELSRDFTPCHVSSVVPSANSATSPKSSLLYNEHFMVYREPN